MLHLTFKCTKTISVVI